MTSGGERWVVFHVLYTCDGVFAQRMRQALDVGLYCTRLIPNDLILFALKVPYRMAVLAPMAERLLVGNLVGLTQELCVMLLACRVHDRPWP